MGCKNQFALHLRVVQLTFSTTNIQPSPVVPMLSQPQSHPTMLINLPLKSQILTGMLAMKCDARPASSILGSAAPVAPISPPAPSRHGYGHGQDRINPRRVQEQPRHSTTGWVWGPRNFPTHLNWPHGLNSRSWLPVLTRFNFLIGISWKSCTFLISRPSMSAPL